MFGRLDYTVRTRTQKYTRTHTRIRGTAVQRSRRETVSEDAPVEDDDERYPFFDEAGGYEAEVWWRCPADRPICGAHGELTARECSNLGHNARRTGLENWTRDGAAHASWRANSA